MITSELLERHYLELRYYGALEIWASDIITTTHLNSLELRTGELLERCYLKLHYSNVREIRGIYSGFVVGCIHSYDG
jgi:hypothetical protein